MSTIHTPMSNERLFFTKPSIQRLQKKVALIGLILIGIVLVLQGAYTVYTKYPQVFGLHGREVKNSDAHTDFLMEVYDIIQKNYWMKVPDDKMARLFQASVEKAAKLDAVPTLVTADRAGVTKMVSQVLKNATSTQAKKQLALDILTVATYNLEPVGRNGLYSHVQEKALRQNVSNVNPDTNLYANLGVEKGAPAAVVEKAYEEKAKVLTASSAPEAKEELKKITYAKKVLTNENNKKMYDESQIEPTINGKIIGTTLYLAISKISPTTLIEFGNILLSASTTPRLDSMVIDFRGNVGGALDFIQVFLGAFIGDKQYAFDLFHQDEYQVQRTTINKFEPLARYRELAILTDNMTQSTAEATAATFKRLRLATVVGGTTRGWGTVENTFPIKTVIDENETYSLFLVHSLTLRDDNQPIEGKGVTPDIDKDSKAFSSELREKLRNPSLIKAVEQMIQGGPLR